VALSLKKGLVNFHQPSSILAIKETTKIPKIPPPVNLGSFDTVGEMQKEQTIGEEPDAEMDQSEDDFLEKDEGDTDLENGSEYEEKDQEKDEEGEEEMDQSPFGSHGCFLIPLLPSPTRSLFLSSIHVSISLYLLDVSAHMSPRFFVCWVSNSIFKQG